MQSFAVTFAQYFPPIFLIKALQSWISRYNIEHILSKFSLQFAVKICF